MAVAAKKEPAIKQEIKKNEPVKPAAKKAPEPAKEDKKQQTLVTVPKPQPAPTAPEEAKMAEPKPVADLQRTETIHSSDDEEMYEPAPQKASLKRPPSSEEDEEEVVRRGKKRAMMDEESDSNVPDTENKNIVNSAVKASAEDKPGKIKRKVKKTR